ncbi:MAG: hypothetical protein LBU77_05545 [Clostridiales bacterium]|jgi:enterochelin esterase-like enzyme|nr:hypothetical protein [Clostridiales bacterium]
MKKARMSTVFALVMSMVLTMLLFAVSPLAASPVLEQAAKTPVPGPAVIADEESPTGYIGQFVYYNADAEQVWFCGDLMLSNHADPSDTKVYTPFEYQPGLMRRGGSQFKEAMTEIEDGYWYYEVPLAGGANQYWFNIDNSTRMMPDPANMPPWSPSSNPNTKNAYNALYVPYDEKQDYDVLEQRAAVENPRTDEKKGTWSYVPITIDNVNRYMGIYVPYGYDRFRPEPYKTIYMLHGAGQDESDWMGIGSIPNIMDNLLADGLTEEAIVVSLTSNNNMLGNTQNGYANLFDRIVPFVEHNYNVSDESADRSFAGLSMGAMNTSNIIGADTTAFGYYGLFSGARANVFAQEENLKDVYMFIGDGLYEGATNLTPLEGTDANYKYTRVAGAHDFNTWNQLFTMYVRDYLWKPESFRNEEFIPGATVIKDETSPTGYTVRFVYENAEAASVKFVADILLRNWANQADTAVYSPFEYQPGFMRGGGAYEADMEKHGDYWVIEVPMTAGANQYWFYVDGDRNHWVADPANSPIFAPDGLTGNARRAFNAVHVPYDAEKQNYAPLAAREIENPREDTDKGTWDYVPYDLNGETRYLGVYLPYGYDENRAEPYKTIWMQHGGGQDASDWMNIGSVPIIMDNLLADGLTEPAIVVTTDSRALGSANEGYPNLMNIILPFIEENYNVSTLAKDRSFAGLSMGAGITANMINYDATKFGYYGVFSGSNGAAVANAKNLGQAYILFGDGLYENSRSMAALEGTNAKYDYLRFAGAHDFNTWCQLFTTFARDYLWQPEAFLDMAALKPGPTVIKDANSPTGYSVQFVYENADANRVRFVADIALTNWADRSDTKTYTPFEYKKGLMRGGGAYEADMENLGGGLWFIEIPLAAGANQYWFYADGKTGDGDWILDTANPNMPVYPEDGLPANRRRAFNPVYVPYDADKQDEAMGARAVENPREDAQKGTWGYVKLPAIPDQNKDRYIGVYLPYGYDENRAKPYKTIYLQHGSGQDASDWLNIGSVPNIMDNLLADGLTEPAVIITTDATYLGSAQQGYPNLRNIIIPFAEESYNVSKNAEDRAFAGLSMGGSITGGLINYDASLFRYFGVWSIRTGGIRANANNLDQPYIFIASGHNDRQIGVPRPGDLESLDNSAAKYKYLEVAGAHDFNAWNQIFTVFAADYVWQPASFGSVKPLDLTVVNDEVQLTASLKAGDDLAAAEDVQVILTFYDADGRLIAAEQTTTDITGELSVTEITAAVPENTATVKAFLWDSAFVPLVAAEERSIQ